MKKKFFTVIQADEAEEVYTNWSDAHSRFVNTTAKAIVGSDVCPNCKGAEALPDGTPCPICQEIQHV